MNTLRFMLESWLLYFGGLIALIVLAVIFAGGEHLIQKIRGRRESDE